MLILISRLMLEAYILYLLTYTYTSLPSGLPFGTRVYPPKGFTHGMIPTVKKTSKVGIILWNPVIRIQKAWEINNFLDSGFPRVDSYCKIETWEFILLYLTSVSIPCIAPYKYNGNYGAMHEWFTVYAWNT